MYGGLEALLIMTTAIIIIIIFFSFFLLSLAQLMKCLSSGQEDVMSLCLVNSGVKGVPKGHISFGLCVNVSEVGCC